jgi:iron complex outermembrane recepter protein
MNNLHKTALRLAIHLAVSVLSLSHAQAADNVVEGLLSLDLDDLDKVVAVDVGSRSRRARGSNDSASPIDVLTADQLTSVGNTADLTDNLRTLLPSFSATPATGDGSAFVRSVSLHGMAPDQMLVLVNGKRRHRSALVHLVSPALSNGAHGPDIGMIPLIALQRVELLRDGAAAQYGSDAIAGVINFALKDSATEGSAVVEYGEFYEGEYSIKAAVNQGFAIGNKGFINLSAEQLSNQALSRGIQLPDAQQLIAQGVSNVGSDSPFGDAPLVQSWGRPETTGTRLFANAGYELNSQHQLYGHASYANTDGRYRFFYRPPSHSSLAPLRTQGFTGLAQGYTPFLDGEQRDYSAVAGLRGQFSQRLDYDLSIGYGENELAYTLKNSINPDLGLRNGAIAKRDFNTGAYEQTELNLNADFSMSLSPTFNLAYGAEWREETYYVISGEQDSYVGAGSNGMIGVKPEDAGKFSRDNYSFYTDIEHDISDQLLLQYALRYEDFSDFGSTLNGKLAARFAVTDTIALRSTLSTGFHAPTPGQANVRATVTTFDGVTGQQVEEGLVRSTSAVAVALGGASLKEEESKNYSLGLLWQLNPASTFTVDYYLIQLDDHIYRTDDIRVPNSSRTISFYTNALDMEINGIDLALNTSVRWSNSAVTQFNFSYNHNNTEVIGQSLVGGLSPVSAATIEDIEENLPRNRWTLGANTNLTSQWQLLLRANYYGSHYDERGTINAAFEPSAEVDPITFVDVELSYSPTPIMRLTLGASNLFDDYINEIASPYSNRLSVGLPYARRSAANYDGGSWYLKFRYSF